MNTFFERVHPDDLDFVKQPIEAALHDRKPYNLDMRIIRPDGVDKVTGRARFGADVCDHHTFVICSDGDLEEGISHEAASLAGHLGLGRLVYVYDDNHITIDGDTALVGSSLGAQVYVRAAGSWQEQLPPLSVPNADFYGGGVALSGNTAVVSNRRGEIRVFSRSGGSWSPNQTLSATHGWPGKQAGLVPRK